MWKNYGYCVAGLVGLTMLAAGITAYSSETLHVTYLWHMHQPIYYPYETVQDTDNNGRFNFSVAGVINDRVPNYQYWPRDAVQQGADRNMAHAGAQMSFSGSLSENCNNLWGYCTGASWDDAIDWARNSLRTTLDNPRLDLVGIGYHHSLMPLTCREAMIMQIKLHKEQYKEVWDTTGYSKGFWPPECAFSESIIPALVAEGLEWVIVDNGHLFRTVPDFPWSSASSCRPNPAEIQNPSAGVLGSEWVQLQNVWAPTKVLAPWAYQPHYVQYIDPWTGSITKIVAVPAGRYEGNENGRGGYGAFKPENVWGAHIASVNTDASHPMLLLCHSDGDNYGMKNSDAWNGQHGNFLSMCQSNPDFEHTSIQDYLDMYPPSASDVIHVEPGSWIGIDGGTPYFEKWLSSTYVNGECPDRWSWSVLIAAQNRVLLADHLESSYTMDDVEWGVNDDTAKAWHYYLAAETSCYWYWDLDRANPWDGNVTRACNLAVAEAQKVIDRHPGGDTLGPSIFPPQRDPYNPGGYMWDETEPASSDFDVWSFVDDVSSIAEVRLYWRTDKNGQNPLSSIQNETYAGGSEVNGWNTNGMTGSWDPSVKGPDNIVPNPTHRAKMYATTVIGQNNVLIDYFVEAVDGSGNTNRSDIMHVYVGESSETDPVTFSPVLPQDCDDLVTTYNSATRNLSNASPVTLMITFDNWGATNTPAMAGTQGGIWRYTNDIPASSASARVRFKNGATIDDNGGSDWSISISACAVAPSTTFTPANPSGCDPITITYEPGDGVLKSASPVHVHVGYNGWQGVITPDPAMTATGGAWKYTYYPPAGAYEVNCCFNDNGGTWENNNGSDYGVSVTNCYSTNVVIFSPGSPMDCDTLTTTYDPNGRPLAGESNIYINVTFDGGFQWNYYLMSPTGDLWEVANNIPSGTTNVSVNFADNDVSPTNTDDNFGLNWSVAVSACGTSGPSQVGFDPPAPTGCDDVSIYYSPNEGALQGVSPIYIHVGHDGWQEVLDPDPTMTQSNGAWLYIYSPPAGTEQINCCFNNGLGTWDNNNGADWMALVTGCTGAVQELRFTEATPIITDDPPTNQNNFGDAFDFNLSGGYAQTTNQGGFGSFGQVYFNYDNDNFYIGADNCVVDGTNNALILFLHFNTYPDWAAQENLWNVHGDPQGLEYLHNIAFAPKVCVSIVIGDEWGDASFPHFNLGDGYDFGQGIFYISQGLHSNYEAVTGAKLSQYDGTGTGATGSNDADGNSLVNRWEASIPWLSIYASNGISDVTNCAVSGVIVSSSTNDQNRYISANYLGLAASCNSNLDAYGNFGYGFVTLTGRFVALPSYDSDNDGIADAWEHRYFSSLGILSRWTDWDGDGATDRDEYLAATHPKNDLSCFQCYSPQFQDGEEFVIRWHSVTNRSYDLFRTSSLTSNWDSVALDIQPTAPENVYTDAVMAAKTRFYQVKTH